MDLRAPSQALVGRARGVGVGSLIAFGWAVFAVSGLPAAVRYSILAAAVVGTVVLLRAARSMRRRAQAMAGPTPAQIAAGRRAWRWFWLNLVGEIILLNVAINLLAAPDLREYWVPAISAVVGLHFWPMARFFNVRSYHWVGALMMAAAAMTAFLIARDREAAHLIVRGEGMANALILWAALGAGAATALRRPA